MDAQPGPGKPAKGEAANGGGDGARLTTGRLRVEGPKDSLGVAVAAPPTINGWTRGGVPRGLGRIGGISEPPPAPTLRSDRTGWRVPRPCVCRPDPGWCPLPTP